MVALLRHRTGKVPFLFFDCCMCDRSPRLSLQKIELPAWGADSLILGASTNRRS